MSFDLGDQSGRTVIITGANSGLGKETARAFAGSGADVIMACRNLDKANAAAAEIGKNARVEQLDLADLASIRDFAGRVDKADVLINNAGVMAVPYRKTADGFEMQMGTNHLGHFALTLQLLDADKVDDRVVTLSSFMHRMGKLDFNDLDWSKRRYNRWRAYGDTKLANLMFGKELARRLAAAGSPVTSTIAHPGYADTELQGHTESFQDKVMVLGNKILAQSAAAGAWPTEYAAVSPNAVNGGFYGPTGLGGMQGKPGKSPYRKMVDDQGLRDRLWTVSEELTGVRSPV
ncbi:MAG: oxidoreductase [Gordonia sp. (in: high G+C Gram-positive bacteria)]|uniref:oxidoreductase n=1 Tax=Gordonia sp. (in: high G+C Gram-positive bacteria) TaxID=84139 RepID=UPI0039E299F4